MPKPSGCELTATIAVLSKQSVPRGHRTFVRVDAVLAMTVPTALGDPSTDIADTVAKARAGGRPTPVVAVDLTQRESPRLAAGVAKLLRCFGIPVLDVVAAADEDAAAFRALPGPVALKAVAPGLLHKSAGGVVGDASFGPLVVFGLGGTDVDSHKLLRSLPAPKALATVDVDAVAATVMRVGRLAELLPEVAEMDLNPLIAYETGYGAADARILLRPAEPTDATLRALRVRRRR
ncbi:acetate--CoA ligase family protein [Kutzneria chonburiensis]|uniref:Acetate--CoA ligase family protein n=1 Tax=Kutzneria chonburiensis TaxID=1483604 RepID=A0ABV6MPT4_9PSEU|nr:acetate--CoA ligase family protein [Kutzneria chonburiensis]